jgi:4-alpha-glucanotransferase
MRHAGLIRIDHIIGFARSYWAPEDGAPGGYVTYPLDALLALTRLEAARSDCLVIGEDLGTVPDGLRDSLGSSGLHGCAVMQFERDRTGAFNPPRRWRAGVAASFGTHDTPTIRGWLRGRDIDWREKTGDFDARHADAARDARARDRAALQTMLRAGGRPATEEDETAAAVHAALADSPAAIAAISLDDALGAVEQQNLPGDVDRHPNWRRRLSAPVDALAQAPGVAETAALMRRARPRD